MATGYERQGWLRVSYDDAKHGSRPASDAESA